MRGSDRAPADGLLWVLTTTVHEHGRNHVAALSLFHDKLALFDLLIVCKQNHGGNWRITYIKKPLED